MIMLMMVEMMMMMMMMMIMRTITTTTTTMTMLLLMSSGDCSGPARQACGPMGGGCLHVHPSAKRPGDDRPRPVGGGP
jgi:hypothetical protein